MSLSFQREQIEKDINRENLYSQTLAKTIYSYIAWKTKVNVMHTWFLSFFIYLF